MKSQSQSQFNEQEASQRIEAIRKNLSADVTELKQLCEQFEGRKPKVFIQLNEACGHANVSLTHITIAQEKLEAKTQATSNIQREQGDAFQKSRQRERQTEMS